MRPASRLLITAVLLAACAPSGAATSDTAAAAPKVDYAAEEKAIRDLDAEWMRHVTAKDTAAITKLYANDALYMAPNMQALGGRAGAQKAWGEYVATPGAALSFGPTKVVIAQAGDLAYDIGTYTFSMDGPKGRIEDKGKYITVWKKVDGAWKIGAEMYNSDLPVTR